MEDYHDKCLRVILRPGETLPGPIDCRQLTVVREQEDLTEAEKVEVEDFDFRASFNATMAEFDVPDKIRDTLFEETRQ